MQTSDTCYSDDELLTTHQNILFYKAFQALLDFMLLVHV